MGRKMLNKLHSRKGASLTFALLAFLVCAVISAVLLASASAAAGRASGLAEMDQRYYAVTSAAQLFCDTLDGQSFTIVRSYSETTNPGKTYMLSLDGGLDIFQGTAEPTRMSKDYVNSITSTLPGATDTPSLVSIKDFSSGSKAPTLLTKAALFYVYQNDAPTESQMEHAWLTPGPNSNYPDPAKGNNTWETMDVTVTGLNNMAVKATMTLHVDETDPITAEYGTGAITIEFKNAIGDPFTVVTILSASIQDDSATPVKDTSEGLTSIHWSGTETYTIRTDTTETYTKTTTITWIVADVKKVS
jgi:hypothetical protein